MALDSPRLTYEDFVSSLHITPDSPDEVSVALTIIGRELNENDLQSADIVCISMFPVVASVSDCRTEILCFRNT